MDKIQNDENYVALKRFNFSVAEVLVRYPDGAPDRLIAQGLGISEEQVESRYHDIVIHLRSLMKVEPDGAQED